MGAGAVARLIGSIGRALGGGRRNPPITVPTPGSAPRPVPVPPPPLPQPLPGEGVPGAAIPGAGRDTEARGAARAGTDQACATCPNCPPRRMGQAKMQPAPQLRPDHKRGYDYQHFVCPWHLYQPEFSLIQEWLIGSVRFDGMHPAECLLIEAKHGYDGFLDHSDSTPDGRPAPLVWAKGVFRKFLIEADAQNNLVFPHHPTARLRWVFSNQTTMIYVSEIFLRQRMWNIEVEWRPFV